MKVSKLPMAFALLAITAVLFAFVVFVLPPPEFSNENIIRIGYADWSLDNELTVHGETIWEKFSDYAADETIKHDKTIKIGISIYWGGLNYNTESMSWEKENGSFSSNSLTFSDLQARWQDSVSVFRFKYSEEFYRVSLSVPKLEDGNYKYADLKEAWEEGELYQTIESW